MRFEPVEPGLAWNEFVVVRLLRRWAAARAAEENALPALVDLARELGEGPELAVTLHSLYQLIESCLARPLEAECCCSRSISGDECAILTLLVNAPDHALPRSSRQIPHGLPGALVWAVRSVKLHLDFPARPASVQAGASCPFPQSVSVHLGQETPRNASHCSKRVPINERRSCRSNSAESR